MVVRLLALYPQATTRGLLVGRDERRNGRMGMFHLYRGGSARPMSFVRVSEGAEHVIEEGIEVRQPMRDYETIRTKATIDMTQNER
jgi:hypothetical protein